MTLENFKDYELRFSYKVEGAIYLEFRNRVCDIGSYDWQMKDKDSPWHQCVIRLVGDKAKAVVDGQEQTSEILGQAPTSGHIRYYMQSRNPAGKAKVILKDIEVREAK
jgi:hypothetical protein